MAQTGTLDCPTRLLDSPEWKALPPPAHEVILAAYRRLGSTDRS